MSTLKRYIALFLCAILICVTLASCERDADSVLNSRSDSAGDAQNVPTDGKDGADGVDGVDGKDGKDGVNGKDGADGKDGKDGVTPKLRVNSSTNMWEVSYNNGATWTSLGVKATGDKGNTGSTGTTPKLRVNPSTNMWEVSYNNGTSWTSLGVTAKGDKGDTGNDGNDGVTPLLQINEYTGEWEVSYDNGSSWNSLGVTAKGDNGNDGVTPLLQINEYTGEWEVSYDNGNSWNSLGVTAKGDKGDTGNDGNDGVTPLLQINEYTGEWEVSYDNGNSWNSLGVTAKGDNGNDGDIIISIEFNSDGQLVITTTGGEYVLDLPQQEAHVHSFGDRIDFGDNSVLDCNERIYYYVCSECNELKWVRGSDSDHAWAEEYSSNGFYHWFNCRNCDAKGEYAEHSLNDEGICTECEQHVSPTDGVEYEIVDDHAEVINYSGEAKRVKIADTYEGYPVTVIADSAFRETDIISVIIPEGVTEIGRYAFYYCYNLTSLTIPDSVKAINEYAFHNCICLTELSLGNGLQTIGVWAFYDCPISNVSIPESVTEIGQEAFSYGWLKKENGVFYADKWAIYFDDSVTSVTLRADTIGIADCAFRGSDKLRSITIPDDVKYIGYHAFACQSLATVEFGDSLEIIGDYAFYGCESLTSIEFGSSLKSIGNHAFCDCSKLSTVTFGTSIEYIGYAAFMDCASLASIVIPDSVTDIDMWAFAECQLLESVVIGSGVSNIGDAAFANNPLLAHVFYNGTAEAWNEVTTDNAHIYTDDLYFYSENTPADNGNYWHYVDGVPTVWEI